METLLCPYIFWTNLFLNHPFCNKYEDETNNTNPEIWTESGVTGEWRERRLVLECQLMITLETIRMKRTTLMTWIFKRDMVIFLPTCRMNSSGIMKIWDSAVSQANMITTRKCRKKMYTTQTMLATVAYNIPFWVFSVCFAHQWYTIIALFTSTIIADFWLSLQLWTWVIWWIYWSLQWMTWMSIVTHLRSSLFPAASIKRIVHIGKLSRGHPVGTYQNF